MNTELLRGWTRYEKARKLNPRQWADLHTRNIAGERFDDMIDALPTPSTPIPIAQQSQPLKVGDLRPGVVNPMAEWPFVTSAMVEAQTGYAHGQFPQRIMDLLVEVADRKGNYAMNERELLELAAKAIGVTGWKSKHGYWNMKDANGQDVVCCNSWPPFDQYTGKKQDPEFADAIAELNWHPLSDDGDCARMESALALCVVWHSIGVDVSTYREHGGGRIHCREFFEDHPGKDKNHARRLASTRCAAEIGRNMP